MLANKSKNETGKKYLFLDLFKKSAKAPDNKKIDMFACNTNLEVKIYQGSVATNNHVTKLKSFLLKTPYAAKSSVF